MCGASRGHKKRRRKGSKCESRSFICSSNRAEEEAKSFFSFAARGEGTGEGKGFLLFAIVNRITKNGSRKEEGGRKKRNGFGRRSEEEEKGDKH